MTRITKMGGRKAPLKASNYFNDEGAEDAGTVKEAAAAAAEPTANDANDAKPAETAAKTTSDTASAPLAPATNKSLQSRLKLLRLKIKKTTSSTKVASLKAEMKAVEKAIKEENGKFGGRPKIPVHAPREDRQRESRASGNASYAASGSNSSALGTKRKRSGGDEQSGGAEVPRWGRSTNATTNTPPTPSASAPQFSARPSASSSSTYPSASASSSSSDHRREKRAAERAASTRCFACRGLGHAAKDCPQSLNANGSALESSTSNNSTGAVRGQEAVGICFKCGSTEHTLKACRKKGADGGANALPFARCFVCSQKGHLSSQCPQNTTRGIYPNGGCCKVCKSTAHLVKDCPVEREQERDARERRAQEAAATGASSRMSAPGPEVKRTKVVSF